MTINVAKAAPRNLTANTLAALDLPLDERIEYLRKPKWYGYTLAKETLERLEDLISYPKSDRMPNFLIVGHTNNGKTTLINRFLKRYPPCDNPNGGAVMVPVLYTMAPPVPDESRFYDQILEDLYAPYRPSDPPGKKEKMVVKLLKTVGTKMLVIDELHNMIAGPVVRRQGLLNAIKNLGNSLKIPIVGAGTKEAFAAIRSDEQLSNRFKHVYLDVWKPDNNYVSLLKSFEKSLALKESSNLASKEMSKKIFYMSEGILGEMAEIISDAAVYAVRRGQEKITLKTLDEINWIRPSDRQTAM